MKLAVLDLGCGNIGSVAIAFERFGLSPVLTDDALEIASADRIVLPGVGAAGYAMQQIEARGLGSILSSLRQPVLGICLGMQLLFDSTEEGETDCLGILSGRVQRLEPASGRPVPHMGWSRLEVEGEGIGLRSGDYVYFAHSYACPEGPSTIARAEFCGAVPAVVRSANFTGAQFHPERSGEAGCRFLRAWIDS